MTSNTKWACVRFNALKGPMANRRQRLEDSLRWHQYNFDSNTELQWIEEHMLAATSTDYGKSLVDAQNLYAKHKVYLSIASLSRFYSLDPRRFINAFITIITAAECWTRIEGARVGIPLCYCFEVWEFSFSSRPPSPLSCINDWL